MKPETSAEITMSAMIEQYKAYLQDLGNIGARHEAARGFYITVLSALLSFLALAGENGPLKEIGHSLVVVIGIGGIAICILWLFHTLAFTALYSAKFGRLNQMENDLPFQNFKGQYAALKKDWRYQPITYIECFVAVVFGCLFLAAISLHR